MFSATSCGHLLERLYALRLCCTIYALRTAPDELTIRSDDPRQGARISLGNGSKTCERIENESHGEYETEHHSDDLRCAPFTHFGRYYPTHPAARR